MDWFYGLPEAVSLPLFVGLFVILSLVVLLALRPLVRRLAADHEEWDRVLGYAIASFGLFYGILLALVAVSVYNNFTAVHQDVLNETSQLAALYRDVSGFPHDQSAPLQDGLRHYTQIVIAQDWPLQRMDVPPNEGNAALTSFQTRLLALEPRSPGDQALLGQTIQEYNSFVAARRSRIADTEVALPGLLWGVLWTGAVINAVMLALIQVKRLTIHVVMAGLIALYVGLLIYETASMDHPYSGTIAIGPSDFQLVLRQVMGG
ncbi:bestrophin-like domain [Pseudolysinimonas sp.]|uniref:bestrophin-like domain n=1 Tax=Pseudolysinimonas sp. TaxID=2680009 RepID=UPI003F7EB83D